MMARRGMLGVLAGGAALLSGCSSNNVMRYKITIEVQTPEGLRTGFAVREVTYRPASSGWFPLGESKGSAKLLGEAVVVDLPDGKTLFALLSSDDGDVDYATMSLPDFFRQLDSDKVQLWPDSPEVREPVIRNPLPKLVTFTKINDPKSVVRVDPADLAASFGASFTLKRIVIEKTSEPVTAAIGSRLPDFGRDSGYSDWLRSLPYGDKRRIGPENFRQGFEV